MLQLERWHGSDQAGLIVRASVSKNEKILVQGMRQCVFWTYTTGVGLYKDSPGAVVDTEGD